MTVEREIAVLVERPLPVAVGPGRRRYHRPHGRYAASVVGRGQPAPIEIPRWIQLVGLPLILLLAWAVAGAVRHAVFLFLVAALVALLLNPLVRALGRMRIPRGFGVAIVYLTFAAVLVIAVVTPRDRRRRPGPDGLDRVDDYLTNENGRTGETGAERDVDRLQLWLDTHRLGRIQIEEQGRDFVDQLGSGDVEKVTRTVIDWAEGAALGVFAFLFGLVLVLVVSVYMLLDFNRLHRAIDRRFPPRAGTAVAPAEHRGVGRRLREGPAARVGDHRRERGRLAVAARDDRLAARRVRDVRDPLRRVGRG